MAKTLLAVGFHPDDPDIGTGGILVGMSRSGWRTVIFIASSGGCGGDPETRRREQEDSARILGAELIWGGFDRLAAANDRTIIGRLEMAICELRPSLILTHWPDDTHQDHRRLATATLSAARRSQNVLFYEGPSSVGFIPTVYHPIDDFYPTKARAIAAHASQTCKGSRLCDFVEATALRRGVEFHAARYAEGFVPFRTSLFLT